MKESNSYYKCLGIVFCVSLVLFIGGGLLADLGWKELGNRFSIASGILAIVAMIGMSPEIKKIDII